MRLSAFAVVTFLASGGCRDRDCFSCVRVRLEARPN